MNIEHTSTNGEILPPAAAACLLFVVDYIWEEVSQVLSLPKCRHPTQAGHLIQEEELVAFAGFGLLCAPINVFNH